MATDDGLTAIQYGGHASDNSFCIHNLRWLIMDNFAASGKVEACQVAQACLP